MFDSGHLVPRSGEWPDDSRHDDTNRSTGGGTWSASYYSGISQSRLTAALLMRWQGAGWIIAALVSALVMGSTDYGSAAADEMAKNLIVAMLIGSAARIVVELTLATYVGRGSDGARTATIWLASLGLIVLTYMLFVGGGGEGIGLFVTLADAALSVTILVNLVRDV